MTVIVLWLAMGALVGWIASLIMGTDRQQGAMINIVVGIFGASVGGLLFRMFGLGDANINDVWTPYSVLVSVIGAVVVIGLVQLVRRGR
jgi:uncharacterized membrane protein YeaQ/YmgE (transglycosylase-associated protein family)